MCAVPEIKLVGLAIAQLIASQMPFLSPFHEHESSCSAETAVPLGNRWLRLRNLHRYSKQ